MRDYFNGCAPLPARTEHDDALDLRFAASCRTAAEIVAAKVHEQREVAA
jgi:hypothetical protein